jgi:hypothetical protein
MMSAVVEGDRISQYRTTVDIAFGVESSDRSAHIRHEAVTGHVDGPDSVCVGAVVRPPWGVPGFSPRRAPGEVARIERPEILQLLPDPDELHRQAELVRDRDRDAALRRAVELRQRDARDADRLAEEARLLEAVLAGRRVDDEQRLVRRASSRPAITRRTFASSSIRFAACAGGRRCRRSRRRGRGRRARSRRRRPPRVAAALAADEVRARALGPDLELLLGRGAERVRRADDDRAPCSRELRASLPIVVVLPVPLTPTTRITAGARGRRASGLAEQRRQLLDERVRDRAVAALSSRRTTSARRGNADVGGDERLLEPLPGRLVGRIEDGGLELPPSARA